MKNILFINIKQLLQVRDQNVPLLSGKEMADLPLIENAFLAVRNELIDDYGTMDECPNIDSFDEVIDARGRIILPSWCDSHTHIVYAGNRINEFVDRINGLSYEEIAQRGGGILNSAQLLQSTSEEVLYTEASARLDELIRLGTGAIEIKSGYGLTTESEIKMLRVIKRLKQQYPLEIKATFLGAHAFPTEYKTNQQGYIDLIIHEMLPKIHEENLADFIDAFLETGYFSVEQTKQIMEAGNRFGLPSKIHVNQFTSIGGVKASVEMKARTVDHLEIVTSDDIEDLKNSSTLAVALPTCSYFISIPYTPARQIIDAGLPLALASDYNPGTTPSGNMNFVVATACIKMKMTPAEAINAATINGAYAMGVEDYVGSITRGKFANLILTNKLHRYEEINYAFGSNPIHRVWIKGKEM